MVNETKTTRQILHIEGVIKKDTETRGSYLLFTTKELGNVSGWKKSVNDEVIKYIMGKPIEVSIKTTTKDTDNGTKTYYNIMEFHQEAPEVETQKVENTSDKTPIAESKQKTIDFLRDLADKIQMGEVI